MFGDLPTVQWLREHSPDFDARQLSALVIGGEYDHLLQYLLSNSGGAWTRKQHTALVEFAGCCGKVTHMQMLMQQAELDEHEAIMTGVVVWNACKYKCMSLTTMQCALEHGARWWYTNDLPPGRCDLMRITMAADAFEWAHTVGGCPCNCTAVDVIDAAAAADVEAGGD